MNRTIFIGLRAAEQEMSDAIIAKFGTVPDKDRISLITHGAIRTTPETMWVGISPVGGYVNLQGPIYADPIEELRWVEDEASDGSKMFHNTSELFAVMVKHD